MTHIREFLPGVDGNFTHCDNCAERAQIVIESFPSGNESKYLCESCAAVALYEHPRLLAVAVVSLILKQEGWISALAKSA